MLYVITNRPRRLQGVSYVGLQRYSLTMCTAHRAPHFTSKCTVDAALVQLLRNASRFDFVAIAYCFMPDHAHVLVSGVSEAADFREFVRRFKQVTAYEFKARTGKALWQPGFYERVLRDDEATDAVARYILENPMRAGLSNVFGEYPFAGSGKYADGALVDLWYTQT